MSNEPMSRNDLEKKLAEIQKQKADASVSVETESNTRRKVEEMEAMNKIRGTKGAKEDVESMALQKKFWAVVWMDDRKETIFLEEAEHKRNRVPTEREIMEERTPFGINRNKIIKVKIFKNSKDAELEWKKAVTERDGTGKIKEKKSKK